MQKKFSKLKNTNFGTQLHTIWRIISIAYKLRPYTILLFVIGAIMEIIDFIVSIFASAKIIGLLAKFTTTGETAEIWFWLGIDIATMVIIGMGFFLMSYSKRILYYEFVQWSSKKYFQTLCQLDIQSYYDENSRNLINKVGQSYIWRMSYLSDLCLDLIYALMRFMAITIVVAQITWWLIPVIALFLIPTLFAEGRLAKLQWFVWDPKGDERHIFWGLEHIIKQAKGQMELRSTQAIDYVMSKLDKMNADFYYEQEQRYKQASRTIIPTKLLEVVGTAIGSVTLLIQFLQETISLDRYFFLSGALLRIGSALNTIFGIISNMQEGLLFANSFFELTDSKNKIIDQPDAILIDQNNIPEIVFENISFTYPNKDKPVFINLNLTIKPGEHVALVGENGAGKSTLIKLLLKFYRLTSGRILINGQDLYQININSWYTLLAILFQEFNQYPLSIDENIYIGRSNHHPNKKLLLQSAKFGGVDKLVTKYKHGWETVLDSSFKKGIEPSGGQWQRIALARAFYRDAKIMILDEPTSAIDAKVEYHIFNSIFEHYQNKTALIVSHRFSTVRRADRIIVLESGKIIEQGSHKKLMKNKGTYYDMFTKQAEGYK